MVPMTPVERIDGILRIAALVAETEPWFTEAVHAYLDGENRRLDIALGLAGPGQDHPMTVIARGRRDAAIRAAWPLLPAMADESQRERRLRFLRRLDSFASVALPRVLAGKRPLADPLEVIFLEIVQAGAMLPDHEKTLAAILNGA